MDRGSDGIITILIPMVRLFRLAGLCLAAVFAVAYDMVPLFSTTQSTITVTAGQRVLALNASVEITAVVVEPSGIPVQNGTAVRFSTTLGRVDPVEVETRNGVATATFHAGSTSGTAEVRATSGAAGGTASSGTGNATTTTATNVVTFTIGAAAADTVTIRTNLSSVPLSKGTGEVNSIVLDANGQGVAGIPVTFRADNGTLSNIVATSNGNGVATVGLTTNVTTKVSATAGSKSATEVTVTVLSAPSITLTCQGSGTAGLTTCTQTVGQPFTLTIAKATGSSALVSAVLTFGDGESAALGTLSSAATVSHTYSSLNAYTATVTATDVNGQITTASVAVATTRSTPSITVTCQGSGSSGLTSCTQVTGQPVKFTIAKASTSTLPVSAVLTFGDGDSATLGTLTSAATVTHSYSSATGYTDTVTATDVNGQTTTSSVAINVTARTPFTAVFSAPTITADTATGQHVAFTVTVSRTTELVESVCWNFGDGASASTSGRSTAHVYTLADSMPAPSLTEMRSYTVTATVRTQDGRTGTARTEIQIKLVAGTP